MMLKSVKQLGMVIRKTRKDQKLTQEQLAAVSGVGIRFIRELEHGKESCQIGKALQVLKMLSIETSLYTLGDGSGSADGAGFGDGSGSGAGSASGAGSGDGTGHGD